MPPGFSNGKLNVPVVRVCVWRPFEQSGVRHLLMEGLKRNGAA